MKLADNRNAPDFIIIGAMKSGTTSIHTILAHHDNVFMPNKEVYFFDVDDISQHADFFVNLGKEWTYHDFDADFDKYLDWYTGFFSSARDDQLIGEDTTTYLASKNTAGRIAKLLPNVKLIAMLRDPVARAYSHYWHNVSAGRMIHSFEDSIRFSGGNMIERGCYADHLERYSQFLNNGQLKVILFEDFIKNKQQIVDELCDYIGLPDSVNVNEVQSHQNASRAPISHALRLWGNRVYSKVILSRKSGRNIPNMPNYSGVTESNLHKASKMSKGEAFYQSLVSKLPPKKYPPMAAHTREFLEKLYKKRNLRLSDLIGQDVSEFWNYMD